MDRIIKLTEQQKKQFQDYYELLISENEKYNLTSITLKDEVYIKHFYDSIVILKHLDLNNKHLVDIGSGAGFPGIPLKIVCPSLHVTLVEPTTKRANFLKMVINKLNLNNIEVINDRAENLKMREHFDYGIARAVSSANILAELITPLIKVNGKLIMLKGINYVEEIKQMKNAKIALFLSQESIIEEILPNNYGTRYIVIYDKLKATTDIYPRLYTKIKSKPL